MANRHKGVRLREETQLLHDAQIQYSRFGARLFRNTVGSGWVGPHISMGDGTVLVTRPSRVTFGLGEGTSDLIGWKEVVVTPDMVGKTVALFLAVEGKAGRKKPTPEQRTFLSLVREVGGLSGVARNLEDVQFTLDGKYPAVE
jgi:hypothetical protein